MLMIISRYSGYKSVISMVENKVEYRLTMVIHLRPMVEVGRIQKLFVWEIIVQIKLKLNWVNIEDLNSIQDWLYAVENQWELLHANLDNASPAYATVMCSKWLECFTSLAKPTMLVHSNNGNDYGSDNSDVNHIFIMFLRVVIVIVIMTCRAGATSHCL